MSSLAGRKALSRSGSLVPGPPGDRERTVLVLRSSEPVPASLLHSVNVCPVLLCLSFMVLFCFVLSLNFSRGGQWPCLTFRILEANLRACRTLCVSNVKIDRCWKFKPTGKRNSAGTTTHTRWVHTSRYLSLQPCRSVKAAQTVSLLRQATFK